MAEQRAVAVARGGKAPASMPIPELAKRIVVLVTKGDAAREKADQFYIAAGIHLKELRERKPAGSAWAEYVKKKTGLGKSRSYELIAIADGRATVQETRARTAERVQKHAKAQQQRPLANGQDEAHPDDDEPTDEETKKQAFLIRANEAARYAVYDGPWPDEKLAKVAGRTAMKWLNVAWSLGYRMQFRELPEHAIARIGNIYEPACEPESE